MVRKRYLFAALPLAIHLLLGVIVLIIDAVHGINDQDFSYSVALLFSWMNWLAVQGLNRMGIELTIIRMMLAGIVLWMGVGGLIWAAGFLFGLCRRPHSSSKV